MRGTPVRHSSFIVRFAVTRDGRDIARIQAISGRRDWRTSHVTHLRSGFSARSFPPAALLPQFPAVLAARLIAIPRLDASERPHRKRARLARSERTCPNVHILWDVSDMSAADSMYNVCISVCLRPNRRVSLSMDAGIFSRARRRQISGSAATISLGSHAREKSTAAGSERSGTSNRNPCARI